MSYPYRPPKFDHGSNLDIDLVAEQLTPEDRPCKIGILVKADDDNTGDIFIGNTDVTAGTDPLTDGMRLVPGDSIFFNVRNANDLYVIGSAVNQKAWYFTV